MARSNRSAEELLSEIQRLAMRPDTERDRMALLHELRVHQEEVSLQTAELTRAQHLLEEARDRLSELYDFAPNGYLTLNREGLVIEVNLTAAAMLGKSRDTIVGLPMLGFVVPPERRRFLNFLRQQRNGAQRRGATETALLSADGPRPVELLVHARPRHDSPQEFFIAIIDISERKEGEAKRDALAHERSQLIGRLISVQEDERRRIARDLHDDFGQQFTALRLKLEDLASRVPDVDGLRERIAELTAAAEHIDRQLDYLVGELRPLTMDLGLVSAVSQLVRESGHAGITTEFNSVGFDGCVIRPDVETHLYRITQEALNNAFKHSSAKHISVLLDRRGDALRLVVEDDGTGFDLAQLPKGTHRGMGLIGMSERASVVGGTIDIETEPGRGTTIFVHVPHAVHLQ